jgi:hypothetical protein
VEAPDSGRDRLRPTGVVEGAGLAWGSVRASQRRCRAHRALRHGPHLVKTGVLHVVGSHLLLAFDLHADVQADSTRHCRLVCSLVCRTECTATLQSPVTESRAAPDYSNVHVTQ